VQRWQPHLLSSSIIVNVPSSLQPIPIDLATVLLTSTHLWTSSASFFCAVPLHSSCLLHTTSIMDPANERKQSEPEAPRFLNFPCLPDDAKDADGKPRLNKYSATITRGHDFPGAQVRHNGSIFCVTIYLHGFRQCYTPLVSRTERQCSQLLKLELLPSGGKATHASRLSPLSPKAE
jgi:hypothetical protein